jgi:hypothetical protein
MHKTIILLLMLAATALAGTAVCSGGLNNNGGTFTDAVGSCENGTITDSLSLYGASNVTLYNVTMVYPATPGFYDSTHAVINDSSFGTIGFSAPANGGLSMLGMPGAGGRVNSSTGLEVNFTNVSLTYYNFVSVGSNATFDCTNSSKLYYSDTATSTTIASGCSFANGWQGTTVFNGVVNASDSLFDQNGGMFYFYSSSATIRNTNFTGFGWDSPNIRFYNIPNLSLSGVRSSSDVSFRNSSGQISDSSIALSYVIPSGEQFNLRGAGVGSNGSITTLGRTINLTNFTAQGIYVSVGSNAVFNCINSSGVVGIGCSDTPTSNTNSQGCTFANGWQGTTVFNGVLNASDSLFNQNGGMFRFYGSSVAMQNSNFTGWGWDSPNIRFYNIPNLSLSGVRVESNVAFRNSSGQVSDSNIATLNCIISAGESQSVSGLAGAGSNGSLSVLGLTVNFTNLTTQGISVTSAGSGSSFTCINSSGTGGIGYSDSSGASLSSTGCVFRNGWQGSMFFRGSLLNATDTVFDVNGGMMYFYANSTNLHNVNLTGVGWDVYTFSFKDVSSLNVSGMDIQAGNALLNNTAGLLSDSNTSSLTFAGTSDLVLSNVIMRGTAYLEDSAAANFALPVSNFSGGIRIRSLNASISGYFVIPAAISFDPGAVITRIYPTLVLTENNTLFPGANVDINNRTDGLHWHGVTDSYGMAYPSIRFESDNWGLDNFTIRAYASPGVNSSIYLGNSTPLIMGGPGSGLVPPVPPAPPEPVRTTTAAAPEADLILIFLIFMTAYIAGLLHMRGN